MISICLVTPKQIPRRLSQLIPLPELLLETNISPGRYRHYKGPEYSVLGIARHSETEELLVVYRQEYPPYGLWVRPAAMFAETVKIDDRIVPRFEKIAD
ncbi:DUF1653 domain-containing protein [Blastopirellula sediminis]|nr:DUF1653 domain-containing protein [Blastopirellula sediminis]